MRILGLLVISQLLVFPEPTVDQQRILDRFGAAVGEYVQLHRRLERTMPVAHDRSFTDPEDMWVARLAIQAALVAARPGAQQGDILSPAVGDVLRHRLAAAIHFYRHDPADILAEIDQERLPRTPDPVVNAEFPSGIGRHIWPTLLRALPELPDELEYRFSNRDLVLLDVHANLVVDILENALPPPTRLRATAAAAASSMAG
jgi:hypothetical protein